MGDEQGRLPGFPKPAGPGGGDKDGREERAAPARLKAIDRAQSLLRAVVVEELIPEDHPARAIWDFVGRLDLRPYTEQIRSVEGGVGRPAYDPQLMVSLWVYSYSRGVSSAREIERLCEHEPAYQWLTGMEGVSAHTLSDFRVDHEEALRGLFVQTLGLLSAEGLITLERVMQDGTRIRACASSSGFHRQPRIEACLKEAEAAVVALEAQTEEEAPRQKQRARERARRERRQRLETALKEFDQLKAAKSQVDRVSTSDPQARVMKQAEGGSAPSYNVQISTDSAHSLIIGIEATQAGSDYRQLVPAMERLEQTLQRTPKQMVVDGGYVSSENIVAMANRRIDLVGPEAAGNATEDNRRKSYRHRRVSAEYEASKFNYNAASNTYVCPQGKQLRQEARYESCGATRYRYKASEKDCRACPVKDLCCPRNRRGRSIERFEPLAEVAAFRQRMQTEQAKAIYRTRSPVAEFPNLWIKAKLGLRQFRVRGVAKACMESLWAALTYDIQQWIRLRWRPKLISELVTSGLAPA